MRFRLPLPAPPRLAGGLAAALMFAIAAPACSGGNTERNDAAGAKTAAAEVSALGAIAYVDTAGCIVRVDVGTRQSVKVCPASTHGVTGIAWVNQDTLAYVTREGVALGWRYYDFATRKDGSLRAAEGPPVVHAGPVQPYNIFGELIEVDSQGAVTVVGTSDRTTIYSAPATAQDLALPQLLTWSPDGRWALLEYARERKVVAVSRDGSRKVEIAPGGRGLVSWFMPRAGATPHMDFTCGLPTAETFKCAPVLQRAVAADPAGSDLLLAWQPCTGATGYEVVVRDEASGAVLAQAVAALPSFRLRAERMGSGGTLSWQVRPLIGTAPGAWSEKGLIGEPRLQQP